MFENLRLREHAIHVVSGKGSLKNQNFPDNRFIAVYSMATLFSSPVLFLLFLKKFFNVYFLRERERERQGASGEGIEGERDTESETGSRL